MQYSLARQTRTYPRQQPLHRDIEREVKSYCLRNGVARLGVLSRLKITVCESAMRGAKLFSNQLVNRPKLSAAQSQETFESGPTLLKYEFQPVPLRSHSRMANFYRSLIFANERKAHVAKACDQRQSK